MTTIPCNINPAKGTVSQDKLSQYWFHLTDYFQAPNVTNTTQRQQNKDWKQNNKCRFPYCHKPDIGNANHLGNRNCLISRPYTRKPQHGRWDDYQCLVGERLVSFMNKVSQPVSGTDRQIPHAYHSLIRHPDEFGRQTLALFFQAL